MEHSNNLCVGQRVADPEGYTATVRYIGPVATSKNTDTVYAGVEWDMKDRGKHDGAVFDADGNEHRYFTCSAGHGSFVKINLLHTGVDMLKAMQKKYLDERGGGGTVFSDKGETVEIVLVGDEKIRSQQQLDRLFNVSLKTSSVASISDNTLDVAPNIEHLDLRNNLLSEWNSIASLGKQLPKLEVLNLGGNKLPQVSPDDVKALEHVFPCLRVLILSNSGIRWKDIQALEPSFPVLEELHMAENDISTLYDALDSNEQEDEFNALHGWKNLQILSLADNAIRDWKEVWKFRFLPKLKKILLNNNNIPTIFYRQEEASKPFETLEALSISSNSIEDWHSIDVLSKFPNLSWLRAQYLPLYEKQTFSPAQARVFIVSRLPNIQTLNGSEVRPRERSDSEKTYVRIVAENITAEQGSKSFAQLFPEELRLATSGDREGLFKEIDHALSANGHDGLHFQIMHQHPRFFELFARYPDVISTAVETSKSSTLGGNIAEITVRSMSGNSCMMEPIKKKLPLTMTVAALKQLAARVFKVEDVNLIRLCFRDSKDAYPIALDDDLKSLSYFGVGTTGEVLLEEVDPKEAAREAAAQESDTLRKMAEQERHGASLMAAQAAGM